MDKTVVIDELHLTIRVPANVPEEDSETIRTTLMSREFIAQLRVAMRDTMQSFPELTRCRMTLSR